MDADPQTWAETFRRSVDLDRIGHVEIWLEWLPDSASHVENIRKIVDGHRVIVHAPFVGISLVGPGEEMRRAGELRLARAYKAATDLGAELVTIHSGGAFFRTERAEAHDRLAECLIRLRRSQSGGPVIAIENMATRSGVAYEPVVKPADFTALKERIPDLVFTLDVGHSLQSGIDPRLFFKENGPSIANVHLHDATEGGPAHLALGSGQLELPELVARLEHYEGFVGLEILDWGGVVDSWKALKESVSLVRRTQCR